MTRAQRCAWEIDEQGPWDTLWYNTSCQTYFIIQDDGLRVNEYLFCPKCGKKIEVKK